MAKRLRSRRHTPLRPFRPDREVCLEMADYSSREKSALEFFASSDTAQAARLADQFIQQNRPVLDLLKVSVRRDFDGRDVRLHIQSGSAVGAVPLRSPITGKPDFGLVVQPRFPWSGIGPMLSEMGWLITPAPLRLPLLRRSERRVPPWVLSVMVLARVRELLDRLERRFEMAEENRNAPKGRVDWQAYGTRSLPRAQFLSVPCTYPDLRDDRLLKGAIRFTLERQLRSLETQREYGAYVQRLISLAESLLLRVHATPARRPSPAEFDSWLRRPLRSESYFEGLQAMEWTVEERGLAGLSDLEGIPWTMPMESFFEAWMETILREVSLRTGGRLRAGRRSQTTHSIPWQPAYLGSQKSLAPDLILELERCTLIVDAKYKRHFEDLQEIRWSRVDEQLREHHREDLLQVLAYANLADTPLVVCCLAYPCSRERWESLLQRGRLFHQAELASRSRRILLWLTAVPMHAAVAEVASPMASNLLSVLWS